MSQTQVLQDELQLLEQGISDQQQALDRLESLVMVPQTMGKIPARIIGQWREEAFARFKSLEEIEALPFLQKLRRSVVKFWELDEIVDGWACSLACFLFILMALVLGLIPGLVMEKLTPWGLFLPWLCSSVIGFLCVFLGLPLGEARRDKKKFKLASAKAKAKLEQDIQRLWSEPVFLITQVKNHCDALTYAYRAQIGELENKFKQAVVNPRTELSSELTQLLADEATLLNSNEEDVPEKQEFLAIVQAQIGKCQELLGQATPKELELAQKFESINARLGLLQKSVDGLATLRSKYENKEQFYSRFKRYAQMDAQRYNIILQSRRSRELQEIESSLNQLDAEVSWTQCALSEVNTLLPAPNSYQLSPVSLLQLKS